MSFSSQFSEYACGPSVPHVHPIVQRMTAEWRDTFINHRKPRWDLFTDAFIAVSCNEASMANPGWHLDLYATDLTVHLIGTSSASMWWILPVHEPSADLFGGDGASIHPHTFMARLTLCAATMAEPEVSAVPPSQIPSSNPSTLSAIPAPAASAAFATNPLPPPASRAASMSAGLTLGQTITSRPPAHFAMSAKGAVASLDQHGQDRSSMPCKAVHIPSDSAIFCSSLQLCPHQLVKVCINLLCAHSLSTYTHRSG